MASSVQGISLPFNKPSPFKGIEQGHHVSAINRKLLRQLLLGCLSNGFKQQQNPVVRWLQLPDAEQLCKLTASFSSQTTQQVGLIGEKTLRQGSDNACIQWFLIVWDTFPISRVIAHCRYISFCS